MNCILSSIATVFTCRLISLVCLFLSLLRAPGERPSQKIIIDIAPLASDPTQALLRYDHPV
jgi:hypothetical protein